MHEKGKPSERVGRNADDLSLKRDMVDRLPGKGSTSLEASLCEGFKKTTGEVPE